MEIIIRELAEKDYPEVTALLVNDLWNNHLNGDHVAPFFEKVKGDERYQTFVAVLNHCVVGLISTVTMLWASSESADMMVQGFVVKAGYRRKGVGTKLIRYAEDYAKAKGIIGVGLASGLQRAGAHAFYERSGYTKGSYHFFKRLNPVQ